MSVSGHAASAAHFLARYEGLRTRLPGAAEARAAAAETLRRLGLPGRHEESWKYTSLRPLGDISFHEALTDAGDNQSPLRLPYLGPLTDLPRLVFFCGRFRPEQPVLPEGVSARVFADAPDMPISAGDDRIVALNTLLAEDGAVIRVEDGVDGGTIVLIHSGAGLGDTPAAFHPRHRISLGAGARLNVVELNAGFGTYLHNPVFHIELAEGAQLGHWRMQAESSDAFHLCSIHASIAARASYDSFTLSTGARLARCEIHAKLDGADGHAGLNAAQLLRGQQHGDFTTVVSHAAPNCASRQTVKNVLDGHARGVFQGKIEVARIAQKTDGYQMNQALLLSPDAEIDSKPQLEIFADDVKCSHGATVGELDPDQIFYMRSRGIPDAQARGLLVRAFVAEAIEKVTDEGARKVFEHALESWWAQAA